MVAVLGARNWRHRLYPCCNVFPICDSCPLWQISPNWPASLPYVSLAYQLGILLATWDREQLETDHNTGGGSAGEPCPPVGQPSPICWYLLSDHCGVP